MLLPVEEMRFQVLTMEPVPGLSDQVFVCHSGLVLDNRVYLSRFRHKREQPHYRKWFKSCKLRVFGDQYPVFFEGGGDAIFSDRNTLWAGYGPRSAKEVYEQLKVLGKFDTVICELIHPKFYHLDTCFTPVDRTTALWFPPAFSEQTKKEIMRRLPHSIAVSEEEANAFVCNAITSTEYGIVTSRRYGSHAEGTVKTSDHRHRVRYE
ncbi:Amidinotransferase [Cooperia oncophora]